MILIELFVYLGIVAAGISGALIGIKKQLDLFGVVFLCVTTSLGGGLIRDVLLGNIPPVAFVKPSYFLVSLIAGLLTWIFYKSMMRLKHVILISDAIGLGVFTAVGANTAMLYYEDYAFLVVAMGLITGIGGGVLRDVFSKEIPYVFRKEIYAIASILGAVCFLITYEIFSPIIALYLCLFITFSLRILSIIYNVHFPVYQTEVSNRKLDA
ncbi:trimeric intracellular cation channel family protein [Halalkalibacter urbisdiaboli]|uniref:trimeric intracellular cation channel family protein n=1 Tax=Halalkalibacter urbisdiaboli TaxID=1960589 RepID=UPI000B44693C|nr:trimeric intracellular cation channel family protein [Halalkalibacter urbisdiaboli]